MGDEPHIKEGKLHIAGVAVNEIFDSHARGHNAAYLFDFSHLNKRLNEIQQTIKETEAPLTLFYAMKANPHPEILKAVMDHDFGIQASSIEEIQRVSSITDTLPSLSVNNDTLGTKVVEHVQKGATFNFESLSQIKEFCSTENNAYISSLLLNQWGLRLRLPQGQLSTATSIINTGGPYAHLGIPQEHWQEAVSLLQKNEKAIKTLHTHIGSSHRTADAHLHALKQMLEIAKDINSVENINLGGGMGAAFAPDDQEFPLKEFCQRAKKILDDFKRETGRTIEIQAEPGEYLLANAGYYLTQVARVNDENTGRNVVLKGTALQAPLYKAHGQHLPLYVESEEENTKLAHVFGSTAHSGDSFGQHTLPKNIRKGDVIVIGNTGAYCTPESTYEGGPNFTLRPTPPMIGARDGLAWNMNSPKISA